MSIARQFLNPLHEVRSRDLCPSRNTFYSRTPFIDSFSAPLRGHLLRKTVSVATSVQAFNHSLDRNCCACGRSFGISYAIFLGSWTHRTSLDRKLDEYSGKLVE